MKKLKSLKNLKFYKSTKKGSYNSFYKTTLVSLLLIFSFFALPNTSDFLKNFFFTDNVIVSKPGVSFDQVIKKKKE